MQQPIFKNNQAVQVLNKILYNNDGNPIGMCEDVNSVLSSNFGTDRLPRRGGCYKGDGICRVTGLGGQKLNNPNTTFFISFIVDTYPEVNYDSIFGTHSNGGYANMCRLYYNSNKFYTYWCPDTYSNVSDIINIEIAITLGVYNILHFSIDTNNRCRILKNGVEIYNQIYTAHTITTTDKPNYSILGSSVNGLEYKGVRVFNTGIFNGVISTSDALQQYQNNKLSLQLIAHYKCDENYGNIAYDSSGNNYHGSIMNAITVTPEENPNSIHQYQNVWSWHNEVGYNVSEKKFIPRNESVKIPPFKDVLGNDLQYIGKVPSKAMFVESCCFKNYNNSGTYLSIGNKSSFQVQYFRLSFKAKITLQNDYLFSCQFIGNYGWQFGTAYNSPITYGFNYGNGTTITQVTTQISTPANQFSNFLLEVTPLGVKIGVNDTYSFISTTCAISYNTSGTTTFGGSSTAYGCWDGDMMDVRFDSLDSSGNIISTLGYYPLCEEIINPSGHIYHDCSGNGNHATLINGSVGNCDKQNEFHYLQKGFNNYDEIYNITNIQAAVNTGLITVIEPPTPLFDTNGNIQFSGVNYRIKLRVNLPIFDLIDDYASFKSEVTGVNMYMYDRFIGIQTLLSNVTGTYTKHGQIFNIANPSIEGLGKNEITFISGSINTSTISCLKLTMLSKLPKHLTNNTDYLGNTLEYQQDDKSFLSSGCFIRQYQQPSLIQADKTSGVWFDLNGEPYDVAYETLTLQDPINEQIFIGNKDKNLKLSPISTHKNNLNTPQKTTERLIRNVINDALIEDSAFSHDVTVTDSDLTYSLYNPSGWVFNAIIDWGDNTTQTVNTTTTQTITKTYTSAGTYTVRIVGTMSYMYPSNVSAANALKVVKINNWGNCSVYRLSMNACSNLVSIPNSPITGIRTLSCDLTNLFNGCSKLAITIPDNLLMYAGVATNLTNLFGGCSKLYGHIPENLLRYCPNLTNVCRLFQDCSGLSGVIPDELLKYCPNLVNLDYLFDGCSGLSGQINPDLLKYNIKMTKLGSYIFSRCTGLTGVPLIPEWATVIGVGAYNGCTGLNGRLVIPNRITKIEAYAFLNCSKITDVSIGTGLKQVDYQGLVGIDLRTLTVYNPVDVGLGNYLGNIFDQVYANLNSITVVGSGNWLKSGDQLYFGTQLVVSKRNATGSLSILPNTTSIRSYSFYNCTGLTGSLIIPDNVTIVAARAFQGCTGFTGDLYIGNSVTSIGDYGLSFMSNIAGTLTLGSSLATLGTYSMFSSCNNIQKLVVNNSQNIINFSMTQFYKNYQNLIDLSVVGTGVWKKVGNQLYNGTNLLLSERKKTDPIIIEPDTTTISPNAFINCTHTGTLSLPNTISTIGVSAFYGCTGITGDLTLPTSLTTMGSDAFRNMSGLDGKLTIPDNVVSIPATAFYDCYRLTSMYLGSGVKDIGGLSMTNTSKIASIEIKNSNNVITGIANLFTARNINLSITITGEGLWKKLGSVTYYNTTLCYADRTGSGDIGVVIDPATTEVINYAFYGCNLYTGTLSLPSTLTTIRVRAFRDCSGISGDLILPNNLTILESEAFYSCIGLNGIIDLPASLTSISTNLFYNCKNITLVNSRRTTAPTVYSAGFSFTVAKPLHTPITNTGYDVAPWTTTSTFSSITADL